MSDPKFIHLRVHSAYSLSKGAIKVSQLIQLCLQHEMPAVAVTDIHNLFGVMDIAKACSQAGIQHIIGSQISLNLKMTTGQNFLAPLIFIAQNENGYRNLIALSTLSYKSQTLSTEGPSITMDILEKHHEDILCLTGYEKGPLGQLLLKKENEKAKNLLKSLSELFDQHLYIELMRHGLPEQEELEPQFLNWAQQYNLPIVATNDVYYPSPDMFEAHDALICISEGRYMSETNRNKASPHKYFKSPDEMAALFSDLPEALENTVKIAKRCSFLLEEHAPILPPFQSPSGLSEKEELRKQASSGLETRLQEHVFIHIPFEKRDEIYSQYFERLHQELDVIEKMGFPGYFLIVSDFIKFAKSQNIPVGPGRGSGAGSLVAWALTITDIDPIHFDLIFERFLNPERISMPDFDVDFCQDRREEVIDYVLEKYGHDKVAQIITFGKLQARAVLRDVGRVLEIPYPQVDKICKLVPNNPAHPVTLTEAIEGDQALKDLIQSDETIARLVSISLKLEGLYRHASTHAAGVVIGGTVISERVPLYYDGESPLAITQINMKYIEKAGLLKFDFLGLKTLTVIQNCYHLIQKKGENINISTIPLDDKQTFELLCSTNVLGVFQLESAGMRDVIKKMKPDRFEDLIALVALYRPGPMDDIPKYLARKHGDEKVIYPHPKLQPILEKTYGVMVYQEQVMQIAQILGGYTLGRADILRRAMGKKNKVEMDAQRKIFIEGAIKNGIEKETASHIFDLMAKFASYGFNKSHSAPYALISYRTAYLKANYPLEFYAASTTYEKNNTDKLTAFFQDMRENNIQILPPDINQSFVNFTPENKAMRYALSAIKNVGEQAMETLIAEREQHGPFQSLEDFASRIDPTYINKRQLENLISAGVFDSLHSHRKQLFESTDIILGYANSCKQERAQKMRSLFGETSHEKIILRLASVSMDWNILEKSQKEFEALGFFMSDHPLNIHQDIIQSLNLKNSSTFSDLASDTGTVVKLAAIILSKEERTSKNGQKFAFITFSDQYSVFDMPFFSENYAKIRNWVEPGLAVYLETIVRLNDDGSLRMTGQTLEKLEDKNSQDTFVLSITESLNAKELKNILEEAKKEPYEESKLRLVILELKINDGKVHITLPGKYVISSSVKAHLLKYQQNLPKS